MPRWINGRKDGRMEGGRVHVVADSLFTEALNGNGEYENKLGGVKREDRKRENERWRGEAERGNEREGEAEKGKELTCCLTRSPSNEANRF